MPDNQEKIKLIVESIEFTFYSIVYRIKPEKKIDLTKPIPFYCENNIKHKDLLLKPTLIDSKNMEVIFTPNNVTPHYYEAIIKKIINDLDEQVKELNNIYITGEVIGYVLV